MSLRQSSRSDREPAISAAGTTVRNAAFTLARDVGAEVITRPLFVGSDATVRDVSPLAGLAAARDLERAARRTARDYIRQARESGHSWHQIGTAMHLVPGGDAQQSGDSIAEAAYSYAAGAAGTETASRYGPSFFWTCMACDNTITDRRLCSGPADVEHGHKDNCPRLAATIAAWAAQWEVGQ